MKAMATGGSARNLSGQNAPPQAEGSFLLQGGTVEDDGPVRAIATPIATQRAMSAQNQEKARNPLPSRLRSLTLESRGLETNKCGIRPSIPRQLLVRAQILGRRQ